MKLDHFILEHWLNPAAGYSKINFGSSCVFAMKLNEFFDMAGLDSKKFLEELGETRFGYGYFEGNPRLRKAIAGTYKKANPELIATVHGGTGANNIAISSLVEAGDNIISVKPSYQQHYSIPKSLGAEVREIELKEDEGYILNMDVVKKNVDNKTKMIILSNPNNPTGVYLGEEKLKELIEIARSVDAYILCDEIYRGLGEEYMPSIVDLYEKGISTSSMSKVYSFAGTRVGWIVVNEQKAFDEIFNRRSYDTICGGVFDEEMAAIALENFEKILARGRVMIKKNKPILEKWLETQKYFHCAGDSVGTTCLVTYDYDVPSEKFCDDILYGKGLLLCHGDCFDRPYSFRLGITSIPDTEDLSAGLAILSEYGAKLESEGKIRRECL